MNRKRTRTLRGCALLLAALLLAGCAPQGQGSKSGSKTQGYEQITQEEARRMMEKDDGHLIVDVRRIDEYEEGHIPGAICVPNESIGAAPPAELPDLQQVLLIYCRSGNRSKQAAQKLTDLGYVNVYEFGGILDWTGEIEKGPGKTDDDPQAANPMPILMVEVGGRVFSADIEDNASAAAFIEKLSSEPLELAMHDYGGFEKVGDLPWQLPTSDARITTAPGDVILYQGDKITIYYGENTWNLTKLAAISFTGEELRAALGEGDASVRFWVEWTE